MSKSNNQSGGSGRRALLKGMAAAILGLAIGAATLMPSAARAAEQRRPNIILMFADDQAKESMGYTGNTVIQTPNMDRLAGDGVFFENAFVTTPICAVSRASILTGQHMRRHGIEDFATPLSDEALDHTYPVLLRDAGYRTAFLGKFAVGNPKPEHAKRALPAHRFDMWYGFPQNINFKQEVDGEERYLTDEMTTRAIEFMQSTPKDQPFCITMAYKEPHGPLNYLTPDFQDYYKDVEIPQPKTMTREAYDKMPAFVRHSLNGSGDESRFVTNPEYFQQSNRMLYAYISKMDQSVGTIIDAVHAMGIADNTVIIYSSDHGSFQGAHGLKGKWLLYEESISVPLIVWDGRLPENRRGVRHDAMALNIDWAPTMLDYAGVDIPERMQGKSLRPVVEGDAESLRDDAYFEHTFKRPPKFIICVSEGIRTERWKYIRYPKQEPVYEELFDLEKDPVELENLVDDAKHAATLARLRARCDEYRGSLE
ncbi:MAG: sulfatase [Planctomycetes bacterium]|nr:sulfatase [Planctomycetota bacterium]